MCSTRKWCAFLMLAAWLGSLSAIADTITVNGKRHENVIVRQSDTRYYVQNPADGSVFSVDKSTVAEGDICLTSTPIERLSLQRRWELVNRGVSETEPAESSALPEPTSQAVDTARERTEPIRITADSSTKRINSPRSYYAQKSEPSPMRGNMGNPGAMRTRVITMGMGGDTMPKILVNNSGGPGGGMGGTGGFGGSQFSNITQLFSNIDDAMVGETPAALGNEVMVSR